MSLTNTNREARRSVRSGGLRDLRFAGTVAAGLVAGVLGVGALSVPLLGWNDWPSALKSGSDSPVTMSSPVQQSPITPPPSTGGRPTPSGPAAVPVVGAGSALVISTGAAIIGAGTAGGSTTAGGTGTTGG